MLFFRSLSTLNKSSHSKTPKQGPFRNSNSKTTQKTLNRKKMRIQTLLFLIILTILESCNGQSGSKASHDELINELIGKGDTLKNSGDHIWYVYQDKKNNYWFGSNGEGIYR